MNKLVNYVKNTTVLFFIADVLWYVFYSMAFAQ